MPVTKQKKDEVLKDLVDKFGRSKAVVFADYRGLDVASISALRSQLREQDSEMKVAKKTLMRIAVKDQVGELDDSIMDGPVVATFSYDDPLSGIRILYKYAKKNDNLKLLGGIMDGKIVGADVIKRYAMLPSREELLAKLMGSMSAPIAGFIGIGNGLIGGMVRVLNAYRESMPAVAAPTPAPTPTPEVKIEEVVAEAAPAVEEAPAPEEVKTEGESA